MHSMLQTGRCRSSCRFALRLPCPARCRCLSLGKPHAAEGDLFLCPAVRLLADARGVQAFEYDGGGHCLVLPDKANLGEELGQFIG